MCRAIESGNPALFRSERPLGDWLPNMGESLQRIEMPELAGRCLELTAFGVLLVPFTPTGW